MISTFVPTIWDARLLAHLDKALVYANLCNRDYEGEIRNYGDTVKINSISDIAVRDYKKGTPITTDDVDGTPTELKIDQQKYFSFKVEDIDRVQANVNLVDAAMKRAAYALADMVDKHVAGLSAKAGVKVGSDASPVAINTADKAYEALVDLRMALDEENVPTAGRFVVVPPWFYGNMLKDDRFVKAGTTKTDAVLAGGFIGSAAGFNIYQSNNVPNTSKAKYKIVAGTRAAMSFAQQILNTEALRMESQFADNVRGLLVFGSLVVQPKALAVLTANPSEGR